MKLSWLQKKVIHQIAGTDRGDKVIAFLESEAASAAYALFVNNLLPAIIALLKKDGAGFWRSLPDEWKPVVKAVQFLAAPAGTRAVGLVDRLDGKGWVPASTPEERTAVTEQLALHSSRLIKDNLPSSAQA